MRRGGRCILHSLAGTEADTLSTERTGNNECSSIHNATQCYETVFTVTADTMGGVRGPTSQCSTGEDVGTIGDITGVAAVLQHGAHGK